MHPFIQVTLNEQTSTNGRNQIEMGLELSGLMLVCVQIFSLSNQVENELENSTQVDTLVVVLS